MKPTDQQIPTNGGSTIEVLDQYGNRVALYDVTGDPVIDVDAIASEAFFNRFVRQDKVAYRPDLDQQINPHGAALRHRELE